MDNNPKKTITEHQKKQICWKLNNDENIFRDIMYAIEDMVIQYCEDHKIDADMDEIAEMSKDFYNRGFGVR
jgi:hypothetical protein